MSVLSRCQLLESCLADGANGSVCLWGPCGRVGYDTLANFEISFLYSCPEMGTMLEASGTVTRRGWMDGRLDMIPRMLFLNMFSNND